MVSRVCVLIVFFFQAEDGIRYLVRSRGLGDVYKRQQCVVLDARDIAAGPVARTLLTHQISSGTHSCWSDASEIRSDLSLIHI